MRKLIGIVILAALAASAQTATTISATGYLTDTMCGAKGATAKHIECAKRNVASGKGQYAIYDESSRRLYILDVSTSASRQTIEQYIGQRVRITGTVSSTPITRAGQSVVQVDESGAVGPASSGAMSTGGTASSAPTTTRVVTHGKALDSSTPVAGVLAISSIETVPALR